MTIFVDDAVSLYRVPRGLLEGKETLDKLDLLWVRCTNNPLKAVQQFTVSSHPKSSSKANVTHIEEMEIIENAICSIFFAQGLPGEIGFSGKPGEPGKAVSLQYFFSHIYMLHVWHVMIWFTDVPLSCQSTHVPDVSLYNMYCWKGLPGNDGLDGVPGNDGDKVSVVVIGIHVS